MPKLIPRLHLKKVTLEGSKHAVNLKGFPAYASLQTGSQTGVGPPWHDMTDSHCLLQEITIFSYLPDSYKVRSGPGVSGVSN